MADICRFPVYDLSNPATANYMNTLSDMVHLSCQKGYNVKTISNEKILVPTSNRVHYYSSLKTYCKNTDNFEFINETEVVEVRDNKVICKGKDGCMKEYTFDSLVICCGSRPMTDEALSLSNVAKEFYIIGDNEKVGSIESSLRSAYGIANTIEPNGKILTLNRR